VGTAMQTKEPIEALGDQRQAVGVTTR